MKRTISILAAALPVLLLLMPAGKLLCGFFGYSFELTMPTLWSVGIAAVTVALTVLSLKNKLPVKPWISIALALSAPLSLVTAVFYLIECKVWAVPGAAVWVAGCFYLAVRHVKPLAVKVTALVLAGLMLVPVGFFGFLTVVFGSFGQNTVVRTEESPDGQRYAELIDSNQGALGGDTLVEVYRRGGFNAIVFSVSPKPQTVYIGPWGEFEFMELYWKNDTCLVINGREYTVE